MEIIEVHNPDAKLLIDYRARMERARTVMIRRTLLNWKVRKERPEIADLLVRRYDDFFKANSLNYMRSAP